MLPEAFGTTRTLTDDVLEGDAVLVVLGFPWSTLRDRDGSLLASRAIGGEMFLCLIACLEVLDALGARSPGGYFCSSCRSFRRLNEHRFDRLRLLLRGCGLNGGAFRDSGFRRALASSGLNA